MLSLQLKGKIHHHDAVLLHNADEQYEADDGHNTQVLMEEDEREKGAHPCRRKSRQNSNRMDETLIDPPQEDVVRRQSSENQQGFIRERIPERCRRTLEIRLKTRRHVHILLQLVNRVDRIAQRSVRRKVKGDGSRRELSLVRD